MSVHNGTIRLRLSIIKSGVYTASSLFNYIIRPKFRRESEWEADFERRKHEEAIELLSTWGDGVVYAKETFMGSEFLIYPVMITRDEYIHLAKLREEACFESFEREMLRAEKDS